MMSANVGVLKTSPSDIIHITSKMPSYPLKKCSSVAMTTLKPVCAVNLSSSVWITERNWTFEMKFFRRTWIDQCERKDSGVDAPSFSAKATLRTKQAAGSFEGILVCWCVEGKCFKKRREQEEEAVSLCRFGRAEALPRSLSRRQLPGQQGRSYISSDSSWCCDVSEFVRFSAEKLFAFLGKYTDGGRVVDLLPWQRW